MRCGTKLHESGISIPANATIQYYKNRPCYLSAIGQNNIIIRYLDGECGYLQLPISCIKDVK